jgi:putative photosynthetic complex assembly protein
MSEAWSQPNHGSERPMLARFPLVLACSVAVASLALVAVSRVTGVGVLRMPQTAIVEYRDVRFLDHETQGVEVRDGAGEAIITWMPVAEGGGFIQNVLRAMKMDRAPKGIAADAPYRVARHDDGRLYLHDLSTGRRQTVDAFGSTQTAAFAKLLSMGEKR